MAITKTMVLTARPC